MKRYLPRTGVRPWTASTSCSRVQTVDPQNRAFIDTRHQSGANRIFYDVCDQVQEKRFVSNEAYPDRTQE